MNTIKYMNAAQSVKYLQLCHAYGEAKIASNTAWRRAEMFRSLWGQAKDAPRYKEREAGVDPAEVESVREATAPFVAQFESEFHASMQLETVQDAESKKIAAAIAAFCKEMEDAGIYVPGASGWHLLA